MNKRKKLLNNILYFFSGNFASKFLSFLLVPLYTSVLTTKEYGIYDLIFTSVLLLLPVFSLTIFEPMLRFSLDRNDPKKIFNAGFFVALIGFMVFFALSPLILFISILKNYYWYFVAYYFVYMLYHCVSFFLKGIGKSKMFVVIGVVNTGVMLGLNILFLLVLKIGITGYILANILSNLIAIIVAFFGVKLYKYIDVKNRPDFMLIKEMLHYSVPLIPNAVSWWISNSSNRYMLTAISGVATSGIFAVANKVPSIINIGCTVVNSAWQLSAVDNFGSDESKDFYGKTYSVLMSLLLIIAGAVILFTKLIARLLYKADFYVAWKVVPILAVAVVLSGLGGFVGTIYTSAKKTKLLMISTLIGAGSNIALNAVLIPSINMYGAAIATAISYLIIWIVRLKCAEKIMHLKRNIALDVASIIILSIEALLICVDIYLSFPIAAICLIAILLLRKGTIIEVIQIVFKSKKKENGARHLS